MNEDRQALEEVNRLLDTIIAEAKNCPCNTTGNHCDHCINLFFEACDLLKEQERLSYRFTHPK